MKAVLLEFKPALLFVAKFIGMYLVGSTLYLGWLNFFNPRPDPITKVVTEQSSYALNLLNYPTEVFIHPFSPIVSIVTKGKSVISVYEGCNSVSVTIIFLSFIVAFGPLSKFMIPYLVLGISIIHLANLFRIVGLFLVADNFPSWLYFTHKYLFSLAIYSVTFLLWYGWIRFNRRIR